MCKTLGVVLLSFSGCFQDFRGGHIEFSGYVQDFRGGPVEFFRVFSRL